MKPEIKSILLSTLFLFWVADTAAQSGGFAGSFSRMGFSPRGMAMGNAMTAVHQEGSYGYYNPAMAAIHSENIQVDLATASLRFDRQLHMITAHVQMPPAAGLSFSLINARVGNIDGRSSSGYHTEMLSTSEYQLSGIFGIRFSNAVWAGIGIKYNLANYHDEVPNSQNVGIDTGIRISVLSKLSVAVAVKDLLSENNTDSSDLYGSTAGSSNTYNFPTRLIAGAAFDVSENWLLSADLEQRFQKSEIIRTRTGQNVGSETQQVIPEEETTQSTFFRLGTRYLIHERVTLRGGIQLYDIGGENQLQPSGGFSIHLPYDRFSPSIDYAILREPSQLSTMHVFAIRLHI